MSNRAAFPDAIVFPDGTIRLVTSAAKQWAYTNTNIDRWCELSTVPDYVGFDNSIPPLMEGKGFIVLREKQPVFHYRSKRRTTAKFTNASEDEYDGHRARFEGLSLEEYRKQRRTSKGIARWQSRNYRRMQEAAEKRKALQDNQLDS
jgi:hypothetical protein